MSGSLFCSDINSSLPFFNPSVSVILSRIDSSFVDISEFSRNNVPSSSELSNSNSSTDSILICSSVIFFSTFSVPSALRLSENSISSVDSSLCSVVSDRLSTCSIFSDTILSSCPISSANTGTVPVPISKENAQTTATIFLANFFICHLRLTIDIFSIHQYIFHTQLTRKLFPVHSNVHCLHSLLAYLYPISINTQFHKHLRNQKRHRITSDVFPNPILYSGQLYRNRSACDPVRIKKR